MKQWRSMGTILTIGFEMRDVDIQMEYWDRVASSKHFTHPIPASAFQKFIPTTAKILDYGCGYGRVCSNLFDIGYRNVTGIDISGEMIRRGRLLNSNLDLRIFDGKSPDFSDCSFDACLAVALLTCIPSDSGQEQVVSEIYRVLKSDGVIFISDYPLQRDLRNINRYKQFEEEYRTFGVFQTEGAVFRHHEMGKIYKLLRKFEIVLEKTIKVNTMNGHDADIFQIMARKKV